MNDILKICTNRKLNLKSQLSRNTESLILIIVYESKPSVVIQQYILNSLENEGNWKMK